MSVVALAASGLGCDGTEPRHLTSREFDEMVEILAHADRYEDVGRELIRVRKPICGVEAWTESTDESFGSWAYTAPSGVITVYLHEGDVFAAHLVRWEPRNVIGWFFLDETTMARYAPLLPASSERLGASRDR